MIEVLVLTKCEVYLKLKSY